MSQTKTQSAPGSIAFQFPEDMPGIQTVVRINAAAEHACCYLNESFTIKLIRQTQSALHFRGKTLEGRGGIVGLLEVQEKQTPLFPESIAPNTATMNPIHPQACE